LAHHVFGPPVRVSGTGAWSRAESGEWKLHHFDIESFEVLDETPLSKAFEGLRPRLIPPEGGRLNPVDLVRRLRDEWHCDGRTGQHDPFVAVVCRRRTPRLVGELEHARERVLVPAPALAEVLVTEGADVQDVLATLRGSAFIGIGDFDERAAAELAMRLRAAIKAGDAREGCKIAKSAMKFDRQTVAIALVNGASALYSDDDGVRTSAQSCGLPVERVSDLPVPATKTGFTYPDPVEPEQTE
jgi:hypothetical protein